MPAITSAALAGAGAVTSIIGSAMSFSQAAEQRRKQLIAEDDAARAMEEARKRLQVNYYNKLGIKKEPYELAREALLMQGVQTLEAAQEGEGRGIGAVAGRLQMAQNQAERQIASDMSQEMMQLDKLKASEDARLRDINANLDLAQAEGAQIAAANAEEMANKSFTQGMTGIGNALTGVGSAVKLGLKSTPPDLSKINGVSKNIAETSSLTGGDSPIFNLQTSAYQNKINPFYLSAVPNKFIRNEKVFKTK
jgi:hypothetical protein